MAMMKVSFASETLCRYVDVNVIVPMEQPGLPGAEANEEIKKETNKKYKTLYLLHGYGGNQDDWLTSSNIRALADQYEIAVVMPSGENSFYVDGQAAGTRWGEMVGKELVEFTRRMFPLSDKREDTFIGPSHFYISEAKLLFPDRPFEWISSDTLHLRLIRQRIANLIVEAIK